MQYSLAIFYLLHNSFQAIVIDLQLKKLRTKKSITVIILLPSEIKMIRTLASPSSLYFQVMGVYMQKNVFSIHFF